VAPLTAATTDEEFVATWLEQHSASPHTRRAYERTTRRFMAAVGMPCEIVRAGSETRLAPARRKAMTLRFAHCAALTLQTGSTQP